MVRVVMLGSAVLYSCVEDYCVEGYSIRECGVGGYCEGRFYIKSVMDGAFGWIKRMLLWNDRAM